MQWDKERLYFTNRQLEREVAALKLDLVELVERAIVVLRLSGKVSYRGIQECLAYLFGVHSSLAEIEAQVQQAGRQAQSILTTLLAQIQVSWVAIDEVYLKEAGRQIYGLLVVDLASRLALTLPRATDCQADTWYQRLKDLPQVRDTLQGLVADLARPYPELIRRLARDWQRPLVLQDCNVHAMRHLFKRRRKVLGPYRRAKQRYQAARKAWLDQPDESGLQIEYQPAGQLYRFGRRLLKYVLGLQGQLIKALRQPSRPAAEAILTQTLAQFARLPTAYQPFVRSVTTFFVRHQPRLLAHFDQPGLDDQYRRGHLQSSASLCDRLLGFQTPTPLISYASLKRQAQKLSTDFSTLVRAA